MPKKIIKFFDKLEDHIRARLSRRPIIYAIVGGIAVVLFWRGVWMMADSLGISGPLSVLLSIIILLLTGLFVSFFIGDRIILSGLKQEKKLVEKEEAEIKTETDRLFEVEEELKEVERDLEEIKANVKK